MEIEFIRPDVEISYKCMSLPKNSRWISKANHLTIPGDCVTIHEDGKQIYSVELVDTTPERTYRFIIHDTDCLNSIRSPKFVIVDKDAFYLDQETQNTVCILRILKKELSKWHHSQSIPLIFLCNCSKRSRIFYGESCIYLKKQDSGSFVFEAETVFLKTYASAEFKVLPKKVKLYKEVTL